MAGAIVQQQQQQRRHSGLQQAPRGQVAVIEEAVDPGGLGVGRAVAPGATARVLRELLPASAVRRVVNFIKYEEAATRKFFTMIKDLI